MVQVICTVALVLVWAYFRFGKSFVVVTNRLGNLSGAHRLAPFTQILSQCKDLPTCERVKEHFHQRLDHNHPSLKRSWLLCKRRWAIEHYLGRDLGTLSDAKFARINERLLALAATASFEQITPALPLSCLAVAGRCIRCRGRLLLGYESLLAWCGALRSSAIDHELVHCMQEVVDGALTQESWGRVARWRRYWIEWNALLFGSTLIAIPLICGTVFLALLALTLSIVAMATYAGI